MGWMIAPGVRAILDKAAAGVGIDRDEAFVLMGLDLFSREVYALMETAHGLSRATFGAKGESHFHLGVNVEGCAYNCRFCSLTRASGLFPERIEFPEEEIVGWARAAEAAGADALNIMTTGTFALDRLLAIGRLLRRTVALPLVANTRDINHGEGERLLEAGFVGAYHAVRLGEGRDTPFKVEQRIHTIRVLKEVGLLWMNCVEPVGPEHDRREIVDLMLLARRYGATYSGIMRRINYPGSPMTPWGMITEREMARMVAVSRLVMGTVPRAHCTHEPHAASLLAGANLFFPEAGASPRDGTPDTAKGRGRDVAACRTLFREMAWDPGLPSNCFTASNRAAAGRQAG